MRVGTRDLMPLIVQLGYDRHSHPFPTEMIQEAASRLSRLRALMLNAQSLELTREQILERMADILGKVE